MNFSEILFIAGGVYHLAIAIFSPFFWRIFRWREDLASLMRVNHAITQILNLCLTFLFSVMAFISFFHSAELISTPLGRTILPSIALFWVFRLILQVVFFGARHKISILFTLIFLIGALLYLFPLI